MSSGVLDQVNSSGILEEAQRVGLTKYLEVHTGEELGDLLGEMCGVIDSIPSNIGSS